MPGQVSPKRPHTSSPSDTSEDNLSPFKNSGSPVKPTASPNKKLRASPAKRKGSPAKGKGVPEKDVEVDFVNATEERTNPKEILRSLVRLKPLNDQNVKIPNGLANLAKKLNLRGRGIHVVPKAEMVNTNVPIREQFFRELADEDAIFVDDESRAAYGYIPSMDEINNIVSEATNCELNGNEESHWNHAVHLAVIQLALKRSRHFGKVGLTACTTASIDPPFIPRMKNNTLTKTKMVDFVMVLEPDQTMNDAYDKLNSVGKPFTSNHTRALALQQKPIAISAETKLTGMNFDLAMVQLCTWGIAHLNKLEELVDRKDEGFAEPIFLPLIAVQGHDWIFFALTKQGKQAVLWQKIYLGSTNDHLGTYALIATLQTLIEWCEIDYRSWFVKNIIRP